MRALITGGAGFVGSHLAERLVADGSQSSLLDDLATGRYANIEHLLETPQVEFARGSMLNVDLIDDLVRRADVVYHLAAAVGVELMIEKPLESLRTNIMGSEITLEKCHKYGTLVMVTSTSEIYGKNASDRLGEEDDRIFGSSLKSRWLYSEAKAIDEILAYTYRKQKGLRTVVMRLFNTVGPWQTGRYGMVIPRFVNQALHGEPLTVYGDGAQTRCFCRVRDAVDAIVKLTNHPNAPGQAINLGGREELSTSALAVRVVELTESESRIRYVGYQEAYEEGFEDMPRRVPETARANKLIGFEPTVDLDDIQLLHVSSGDR